MPVSPSQVSARSVNLPILVSVQFGVWYGEECIVTASDFVFTGNSEMNDYVVTTKTKGTALFGGNTRLLV